VRSSERVIHHDRPAWAGRRRSGELQVGCPGGPGVLAAQAATFARFLIFTGVIVVFATAVIIATKGQLGRAKAALETEAGVSDADR
jgi:hypothetical protein